MANLTVAEKNHWRDRVQARIDRKIEAVTAGDPGLMERVKMHLTNHPTETWDAAVRAIVEEDV